MKAGRTASDPALRLDWEYPQDKKVLLYLQEFMIGDLLVVPEKEKSEIYLAGGIVAVSVDRKGISGKTLQEAEKSVRAAGTLYPAGSGFDPGGGYCLCQGAELGAFDDGLLSL